MKILVLGVATDAHATLRTSIETELYRSTEHHVEQHWQYTREPKKFIHFNVMHAMAAAWLPDYVLFVDDDIVMPAGFLDTYIKEVRYYNFALAQPARSRRSTGSHPFVFEQPEYVARQTRFVECGPVFSMDRAAQEILLPFDNRHSGMGGGRDFVWPYMLECYGLKLGIIDSVPIDHTFRPDGMTYDRSKTNAAMRDYLQQTPHIAPKDAMVNVETYAHDGWIV